MTSKRRYPWWKEGVIYEIWPRSFYDASGDGSGDIRGMIEKLDYLTDLGVGAVWLGPINGSPMTDQGYDVSDYRDIDPLYGTMAGFTELLKKAHARGIRIIMDLPFNHSSDRHPWFIESRSSRDNPRRDWYIWEDRRKGGRPTNWRSVFGGSAWQRDNATGQYYLHSFLPEQPDLNWRNAAVRREVYDTLRFWLDRGVDGFRLDVMNYYLKDDRLRDNPVSLLAGPYEHFQRHLFTRSHPGMFEILAEFRSVLDEYDDRMMVAEVYVGNEGPGTAASYLGEGDLCHLSFDFSLLTARWDARRFGDLLERWYAAIPEKGWPCTVLSNHDRSRSATRYAAGADTARRAKVLAALLLTVKGTPFIYYGEEIGMRNVRLKKNEIDDVVGKKYWPFFKGRDGQKTPMLWDSTPHAGFTRGTPWLPVGNDYGGTNVASQERDPDSLLSFYRDLIGLRKEHPPLSHGDFVRVPSDPDVLAYTRRWDRREILVLLNFSASSKRHILEESQRELTVVKGTGRTAGSTIEDRAIVMGPYEVLITEAAAGTRVVRG
jgi:alpha-glucosidase